MTNGSKSPAQLLLADQRGLGRIEVGLEPFFEFSFDLAEDLQDLIDKWRHRRSPHTAKLERNRKPLPK